MYSLGNHLLVFILGYIFRIGYVVNQVGSVIFLRNNRIMAIRVNMFKFFEALE